MALARLYMRSPLHCLISAVQHCSLTTCNGPYCAFFTAVLQAVWVFTTLLPVLLLNTMSTGGPAAVLWTDIVGGAVFATGLLTEAVADGQKFAFKLDPSNKGKFIDSGLWSFSRYPNYFGEMMVWWGMFVFCAGGLQGAQFASVASPFFVMLLLRFVSGVPLQEKQAEVRWGTTQDYMDYRARTNLLVPLPKCWNSKSG
jgi:steroid 5-alpha reductase family enzyme